MFKKGDKTNFYKPECLEASIIPQYTTLVLATSTYCHLSGVLVHIFLTFFTPKALSANLKLS